MFSPPCKTDPTAHPILLGFSHGRFRLEINFAGVSLRFCPLSVNQRAFDAVGVLTVD